MFSSVYGWSLACALLNDCDTMKNRVAWGLVVVLAVVLLGGVVFLQARTQSFAEFTLSVMPSEEGQLYRLGWRLGMVDGSYSQDLGDVITEVPGALFFLLSIAPEYVQKHPTVFSANKQTQARMVRQASELADRIDTARAEQQQRYVRALLVGYRAGNRLGRLQQRAKQKMLE